MLTVRLTPVVKSRADYYAELVGISLNALVAVALTEYLDARAVSVPLVPAGSAASVAPASSASVRSVPVQPGGRNKKRR